MVAGVTRSCSTCGDDIIPGDRFCATCGTRVDRACNRCGVMLVSGDRFCPDCGAPQESTGPNAGSTGGHSSAWDAVVRVLRSSLAGDYRITRELGRGGQAAVFQADEIALNRIVAIKVLAPGSISGERQIELFRREAQTIANLKHPNIVTIYSVPTIEDLHLFVMQYIEGRSLAAIISDRGPLPLTAIRAVAFQIGTALQYAHRRNVIHRDVKPANVLFDEDGNAILTDFGIAKDASNSSSMVTGSLMGTAAYMSPEQCQQAPVTWTTDQYSLGILLYEMLTGSVPFEGTSFTVMQGHTDREPPSIRAVRGDCPVELEWAVMRMLAKRPSDRWPSIPDALEALGAGPLTRDDPIRGELKRLARWAKVAEAPMPSRLTLRVPERLEVGESTTCEVFAINATDTVPQRITASWRVADSKIAECDANTGVLLGVAPGRTMVSAESAQGLVDAEVSVVAAVVRDIVFTLARPTLTVGETIRVAADVRDRRGVRLSTPVRWSVTEGPVASISDDGLITALGAGMTSVVARVGEVTAERMLFVQEANAASLTIAGGRSPLLVQESLELSATVFDAKGQALGSREIRWESNDRQVASVDRYGVVRALSTGQVMISARSGEANASILLMVKAEPVPVKTPPPVVAIGPELITGSRTPTQPQPAVRRFTPVAEISAQRKSGEFDAGVSDDELSDTEPDRSSALRRAAVVVLPLLLIAFLAWRWNSSNDETVTPTAIAQFSAPARSAITDAKREFNRLGTFEDFSQEPGGSGALVRDGRLVLAPNVTRFGLPAWKTSGDFAAHLDVAFAGGGNGVQAGIVMRISELDFYFLQLMVAPVGGLSFSRLTGAAQDELIPWTANTAVHSGNNSVDVTVISGILKVFVNGVLIATSRELPAVPDGQIGVFAGQPDAISFDNLTLISLKAP